MDDWNLDGNSIDKWQWLQDCKPIMPEHFTKVTNDVKFTFNVGDTTQAVYK